MWIIHFDPRMRIALTDRIISAELIPFRSEKARHEASRDADASKHDHHSSRIVLAVPGLPAEEKIVDRLDRGCRLSIETVLIVGQQMVEDGSASFMDGQGAIGHSSRQLRNPLEAFGELQIPAADGRRIIQFTSLPVFRHEAAL